MTPTEISYLAMAAAALATAIYTLLTGRRNRTAQLPDGTVVRSFSELVRRLEDENKRTHKECSEEIERGKQECTAAITRIRDAHERELVRVSTDPWGIESSEGLSEFTVLRTQISVT